MAKDSVVNSGETQAQSSNLPAALDRNAIALSFATALVYRKDGSGTGTGIMTQAFTYADAFIQKAQGKY